ncbi:MAG: AmmeMemoRadiSam system protein B, partial [Singulisphaera sp.]|nr:AmmeMemoRadiSam system protein B [Singulisphaera sp.]
ADELLAEAASQARVSHPGTASVFSLDALTNAQSVVVSTAPRPVRGPAVRPAAVAGSFYDADAAALARTVDGLLAGECRPEAWPAAMVPHAGLIYSGKLAAAVFHRLEIPEQVIVIGPKHTRLGVDWAVAPHETWSIPGATIPSDPALARALAAAIPGLQLDAAAHRQEHAIEVELPFLARLAPRTRVVGMVVGGGNWERCRLFAHGLAEVVRGLPSRPLLVISSDMNHFATDRENRQLDEIALRAMGRLDPAHLLATVNEHNISMCGVLPAVIVMECLRLLGGLQGFERVGYATSADVSGDTSRVVGYAGVLLK